MIIKSFKVSGHTFPDNDITEFHPDLTYLVGMGSGMEGVCVMLGLILGRSIEDFGLRPVSNGGAYRLVVEEFGLIHALDVAPKTAPQEEVEKIAAFRKLVTGRVGLVMQGQNHDEIYADKHLTVVPTAYIALRQLEERSFAPDVTHRFGGGFTKLFGMMVSAVQEGDVQIYLYPETSLDVHNQRLIHEMFKTIPNRQVITATHSPCALGPAMDEKGLWEIVGTK